VCEGSEVRLVRDLILLRSAWCVSDHTVTVMFVCTCLVANSSARML